jgi:hypothetical protein
MKTVILLQILAPKPLGPRHVQRRSSARCRRHAEIARVWRARGTAVEACAAAEAGLEVTEKPVMRCVLFASTRASASAECPSIGGRAAGVYAGDQSGRHGSHARKGEGDALRPAVALEQSEEHRKVITERLEHPAPAPARGIWRFRAMRARIAAGPLAAAEGTTASPNKLTNSDMSSHGCTM